ncbi:MAG TPA: hypothetical protein VGK16_09425 [Candidatus Limnocylindrales bacterium]|jgi:hypothetical protein
MLASNPVDPSQAIRIYYQSPAGPSVAFPREDEGGAGASLKLLAAAALLATGYVIGGFAVASTPAVSTPVPVEADGGIGGGPVSKVDGSPVNLDQVIGEYRLGPGNEPGPGLLVELQLPEPAAGDFRLSPGNQQPVGIAGK